MGKILFKPVFFILLFIIAFSLFLPMKNLYYLFENTLYSKYKIVVSNEILQDKIYSLDIQKGLLYQGNELKGSIENINFTYYLFYNKLSITNMKLDNKLTYLPVAPIKIDTLQLEYSIKEPLYIPIIARGDFGSLKAKVDLLNRNIEFILKPSSKMRTKGSRVLHKMKSTKGVYSYVYKY